MTTNLDLLSPSARDDPHSVYHRLREHDPVHWSATLRMWVVTRYDDVDSILHQPLRYSVDRFRRIDSRFLSSRPDMRDVANIMRDWAVYRDPPEHTRLRALLNHAFTPRRLESMRPRIQHIVDELLDAIESRAACDFVRDFAFPLPATVISTMLGVPADDVGQIKAWSDQIAAYIGGAQAGKDNIDEAKNGLINTCEYFHRLVCARRSVPADDLLSDLLAAEDRGQMLGDDELVANCVLLLFAGHETTTNLLANGLYHLLRNPQQLARLRCEPELVTSGVEELLRYDTPVAGTIRVTSDDVELRGRKIERGALVAVMLSAANRDPAQFAQPDELDLARSPNRHLSYGHGIHFCLGAGLARMEVQIALTTLLRRFARISLLDESPQWKPQVFFRGLRSLRIELAASAEVRTTSYGRVSGDRRGKG